MNLLFCVWCVCVYHIHMWRSEDKFQLCMDFGDETQTVRIVLCVPTPPDDIQGHMRSRKSFYNVMIKRTSRRVPFSNSV